MMAPVMNGTSRRACCGLPWAIVLLLAPVGMAAEPVTARDTGRNAFSHPLPGLSAPVRRSHAIGNSFFNENWVAAPASAAARDGLGPLFNARSCSACHPLDGRGSPDSVSLILRISILREGSTEPHPIYGGQIRPLAIPGARADARITLEWLDQGGLRQPHFRLEDWRAGPPQEPLLFSPRMGNAVFGLGLLESVPADVIEARADPEDRDGDGISGRVNQVWDKEQQTKRLGRFGWKANQPSLRQQTADAFHADIGITSVVNPHEFPETDLPHGGSPELPENLLQHVVTYLRTLAPPARRDREDGRVKQGEEVFRRIGCAACHLPELRVGEFPEQPALSGAHIEPFTDLLLHDMGPGLADGRPDQEADGREWRTAALWGLGLQQTVNGHLFLLHDGRARGIAEAILWHDGEAAAARQRWQALPEAERAALLRFLESL
jgi:CxxC motif-containing protein (DUF1111 family)